MWRSNRLVKSHRLSEDCLTLNIWKPKDATGAPVIVWIHGGALATGYSHEGMYDGGRLAEKGAIVVSINYRLGALGYLAHPELSAESPIGVSGNYGLLDQVAALEWVKRNIASFGGDPDEVTIAGESAGGLSVLYLMASPIARGLFDRAIAQSAYMISTPELTEARHGSPAAETAGATLARTLQAPSLRAFHASELPYMFGTLERTPPRWPAIPDTADERRLSDAMVDYWTGFVKDGRPVAPDAPTWPAFGTVGARMVFDAAVTPGAVTSPGMFELHEEAVSRRRAAGDQP